MSKRNRFSSQRAATFVLVLTLLIISFQNCSQSRIPGLTGNSSNSSQGTNPTSPTSPVTTSNGNIVNFEASPSSIYSSQSAVLSWTVVGATDVIVNGQDHLGLQGSLAVTPTETTTYSITAVTASGPVSATVTVNFLAPPANVVTAAPSVTRVSDTFASGSNLYLATDQGVLVSSDSGKTFSTVAPAVAGLTAQSVYAANGIVYVTYYNASTLSTSLTIYDGNTTITPTGIFLAGQTSGSIPAVRAVGAVGGEVFVGTDDGLFTAPEHSANFKPILLPGQAATDYNFNVHQIAITSNGIIGVAANSGSGSGTNGGIYTSSDGGQTFTVRTSANGLLDGIAVGVSAIDSVFYATTWDFKNNAFVANGFSRSSDGGQTFTTPQLPTALVPAGSLGSGNLSMINMLSVNGQTLMHYYLNDEVGGLLTSSDGGNTFTQVNSQGGLYVLNGTTMTTMGNTIFASYGVTASGSLLCESLNSGVNFKCGF